MRDAVILPEMLQAGIEALQECQRRKKPKEDICVAIYLAMEAIREIYELRRPRESIH